jgi:hypothetical protein
LTRLTDLAAGFDRASGTSSSESDSCLTGFFLTTGEDDFLTCEDGFGFGFDFAARGTSSSESDPAFETLGFFDT